MKIYTDIEQRSEAWFEKRLGVVSGTGLKKILGTPKLREGYFYEILAERLSTESNSEENAMDRGSRLEEEAIKAYEGHKNVQVARIGFTSRDDSRWIGSSPDGLIEANGKYTKGLEIKCLSSANHLKAYLTNKIPEEYFAQGLHYFIVNDDLQELDFMFYDPRITKIPFFVITIKRDGIKEEIEATTKLVKEFIEEVNIAVDKII